MIICYYIFISPHNFVQNKISQIYAISSIYNISTGLHMLTSLLLTYKMFLLLPKAIFMCFLCTFHKRLLSNFPFSPMEVTKAV